MKRRNCLQQIIGILLCCTLFSSCLDDNEPETFFPTLGTVNADENDITIESDSYGLLIPTKPRIHYFHSNRFYGTKNTCCFSIYRKHN